MFARVQQGQQLRSTFSSLCATGVCERDQGLALASYLHEESVAGLEGVDVRGHDALVVLLDDCRAEEKTAKVMGDQPNKISAVVYTRPSRHSMPELLRVFIQEPKRYTCL